LIALIVGYFMVVVDMTIVAVANPEIVKGLHADIPRVVWVTSAYLLTFAALLLPAGRLGDRFGPKRVYLAGLAVFTAASLACGLAHTIGMLIAARAAQGVGAALVTPQSMAVITRTFPPERRSAAMSLWGGVAGLANLVGPLLGGVLVDGPGWQWIFFVNVPIGIAGFALAVRFVPALPTHMHRFDIPGVVLSCAGMFLLVYGIQQGGAGGWDAWTRSAVAAGLAVLIGFVVHQSHAKGEPLLPLGIFRDRNFAISSLAVALAAGAVAAVMVPLYFYLETVRAFSGVDAGALLAPMAVFAILFVPLFGKFGDRLHPRTIPVAGLTLFAVALACFAVLMTPGSPVALFVVGAALVGIANAGIWPALAVTATLNIPPERAGAGAGAYNTLRQVGSVLGSAAISAVVAARLAAHHLTAAQTGGSGTPPASVPQPVRGALGSALGESLFLPVALLAIGAVLCLRILRARRVVAQAVAEAGRVEADR
jgi:EmrB/QacA subfamily drug resistance transporter